MRKEELAEQRSLANIAENGTGWYSRETAIKQLTDPDALLRIANSDDTDKYTHRWETNNCIHCGDCTHSIWDDLEPCNLFYDITEHTLDLRETARARLAELGK